MRLRTEYIIIFIAILILALAGCSRELSSGDETRAQIFPFESIPALSGVGSGGQASGQLSAGETEPVIDPSTGETPDEEPAQEDDPMIAGLMDSGRDAVDEGDLDLAAEYFLEVVERDENHTAALYNLGRIYRLQGDADRGVEYARRAVETDPTRLYVHQNLAFAYEAQGDIDSAIEEYERELENHPNETRLAGIAENLALIYLDRGLRQEAFDAARRSVNLEPDQASHHAALAAVHMVNGAFEQAIGPLEQAVTLEPESAFYRKLLADALWEAGRQDEARYKYAEAIDLEPEIADQIDEDRLLQDSSSDGEDLTDPPM